jgi:hypothetical protein
MHQSTPIAMSGSTGRASETVQSHFTEDHVGADKACCADTFVRTLHELHFTVRRKERQGTLRESRWPLHAQRPLVPRQAECCIMSSQI